MAAAAVKSWVRAGPEALKCGQVRFRIGFCPGVILDRKNKIHITDDRPFPVDQFEIPSFGSGHDGHRVMPGKRLENLNDPFNLNVFRQKVILVIVISP